MKKFLKYITWNNILFVLCMAVYFAFAYLYMTELKDPAFHAQYYKTCWNIFYGAMWVNMVGQMTAAMVFKKDIAFAEMIIGLVVWYFVMLGTTGMQIP